MILKRRFFLLAAPAIVAAPSLMRVSAAMMPPQTLEFAMPHTPPFVRNTIRVTNDSAFPLYFSGLFIAPFSTQLFQMPSAAIKNAPGLTVSEVKMH